MLFLQYRAVGPSFLGARNSPPYIVRTAVAHARRDITISAQAQVRRGPTAPAEGRTTRRHRPQPNAARLAAGPKAGAAQAAAERVSAKSAEVVRYPNSVAQPPWRLRRKETRAGFRASQAKAGA